MNLIFSQRAEEFLEKEYSKHNKKLNLVLHAKQIDKTCFVKLEPAISFETDENYLEGIDKISDWQNKVDIFMDPVIEPLLKDKNEIKIDLKGKIFKSLQVEDAKTQVKLSNCTVTIKRPKF
ncbi:MAG: hypothetical protein ACFFCM_06260 [Promethearchaeota archaeon]